MGKMLNIFILLVKGMLVWLINKGVVFVKCGGCGSMIGIVLFSWV